MPPLFLDSSALIAYFNVEDEFHDILRELEIFKRHPMPSFDALICAVMQREGITFLLSFDRVHLDDLESITRIEQLEDLTSGYS